VAEKEQGKIDTLLFNHSLVSFQKFSWHMKAIIYSLLMICMLFFTAACNPIKNKTLLAEPIRSYRCGGTEPFWSTVVDSSGITWHQMGEQPIKYPYNAPSKEGEVTIFETSTSIAGKNSTLKIKITAGPCSDGMSDTKFPYSAEVIVDGMVFKGCAE
jgi:uncharacterized membrane protein